MAGDNGGRLPAYLLVAGDDFSGAIWWVPRLQNRRKGTVRRPFRPAGPRGNPLTGEVEIMQQLPHKYAIAAAARASGNVTLSAAGLPQIASAPPVQFGGPGDKWSPEDLLVAAVASCFVLTFRAVARASKLQWTQLECGVEGTLERVAGLMQFSKIVTRVALTVPDAVDTVLCERVLTKAEHDCLVTNSLRGERQLQIEIVRAVAGEQGSTVAAAP